MVKFKVKVMLAMREMTQKELAEKTGIRPPTISAICTGAIKHLPVDVLDRINFDLTKPQGKMVETLINGRKAQYIEPLHDGDELEIFWKD